MAMATEAIRGHAWLQRRATPFREDKAAHKVVSLSGVE